MHIYVIRHAQSSNNALRPREVDPALTPLGERQAKHLARALRGVGLTAVYASPMRRAIQTAARIGDTVGLPVEVLPELCEVAGLRTHRGMSRVDMLAMHPRCRPDASITDGWWHGGEEDVPEVQSRARCAAEHLRSLERSDLDSRLAVVTHGMFASYLIGALLNLDLDYGIQFAHRNTAVTLLESEWGVTTIRYANRYDHLPEHLVT